MEYIESHCAHSTLPFPYWRDYAEISAGAVFLSHTSTASGAMRVLFDHNCAPQLHNTPRIVMKFPLVRRHFQLDLNWREENKYQLLGYAVQSPQAL